MPYKLSSKSRSKLVGVHPDLVEIVEKAITLTTVDFAVIEGLRTLERQKELLKAGASRTMNSRHLTGHAVDLAAYVGQELRWDWPLYRHIAAAMSAAAFALRLQVEWGGDWKKFKDGPHFQLPRLRYPA